MAEALNAVDPFSTTTPAKAKGYHSTAMDLALTNAIVTSPDQLPKLDWLKRVRLWERRSRR